MKLQRGLLLLLALHSPLFALNCFADSAGTEAGDFLRIGASGRQAAMGEAAVGLSDDANAGLWNPAAWGRLRRHEVSLLRTEWIEKITYTGALYGHSTERWGNLGVGFLRLDIPDIQGYDTGGRPHRSVKASDQLIMAGYGRSIGDVSLGGNLKLVQQTLDNRSADAWAGDLGLHWKMPWGGAAHKFHVAAAGRNLGGKIQFIEKSAPLPVTTDIGLAYQTLNDSLSLDADISFSKTGAPWRLGAEYWIRNVLALRMGYKPGVDLGNGLSFGFGVHVRRFYIDYAFADMGRLEETHRISLRARFGGVVEKAYKKSLRFAKDQKYPQALGQLDQVLSYEPYNTEALSQFRSIKQIYELQVSQEPPPQDAYRTAQALFQERRYLSALDKFVEALSQQPEREPEIRRYVAIIGAEMRGEEALTPRERAELRQLMELEGAPSKPVSGGQSDQEALRTAKRLYKQGQHLRARDVLDSLQRNAADPADREEARSLLNKTLVLMTDHAKRPAANDPQYAYALGYLSYVNNRHDQAITLWRRVLELTPNNEEVRSYLESTQRDVAADLRQDRLNHLIESGLAQFQAGRYELARETWMQARQIEPDNPTLAGHLRAVEAKLREQDRGASLRMNFEKAKLYYEVGQWNKAIDLIEEMKKLAPLDAEAQELLTRARQQKALAQERLERQQTLERARAAAAPPPPSIPTPTPAAPGATPGQRDPSLALSLYQRGLIAYAQGKLDESIRLWQESLTYNPDNERVKKALQRALTERDGLRP